MPGPLSAPNGQKALTVDMELRRDLAAKRQLDTGKTALARRKAGK